MFTNKPNTHDYSEVLGKKFTWCIDRMNEPRKVHMAIEILVEEIKLFRSLAPSDEISDRILEGYIHESWGKDLLPGAAAVAGAPA